MPAEQRGDEHSDVETSTASDDSNSVHPWTVVTSPSARAAAAAKAASVPEEGEVSSPIASDPKPAIASPANPVTPRRPGYSMHLCMLHGSVRKLRRKFI